MNENLKKLKRKFILSEEKGLERRIQSLIDLGVRIDKDTEEVIFTRYISSKRKKKQLEKEAKKVYKELLK